MGSHDVDRDDCARSSVDAVRARELEIDGRPALLVRPAKARILYVLAHGAGAGMRHAFMTDVAAAFAHYEIATLRWELPYMAAGKSRPDSPAVAQAAVRATWTAACARFGGDMAMFAGGKSFGGRMTSGAHAAEALADLRGLVFLGFPLHPPDKPGIDRAAHLSSATGPLLFVQGTRDELADLALLRGVIRTLGRRATLHLVEHADHGFDVLVRSRRTRDDVLHEIARTAAEWMRARSQ